MELREILFVMIISPTDQFKYSDSFNERRGGLNYG